MELTTNYQMLQGPKPKRCGGLKGCGLSVVCVLWIGINVFNVLPWLPEWTASPAPTTTYDEDTALAPAATELAAAPPDFSVGDMSSSARFRCLPNFHPQPEMGTGTLSHYCEDSHQDKRIFYMLRPGCTLPPPQPYWLEAALTTAKAVFTWMLLYTHLESIGKKWYDEIKIRATFYVNWGMLAMAVVGIAHKVLQMDAPSLWERHQCFGLAFSFAPWASNFLLAVGQEFAAGAGGHGAADEAARLLRLKRALFDKTQRFLLATLALTLGPFAVTHLALGMLRLLGAAPLVAGFAITRLVLDSETRKGWSPEQKLNNEPLVVIPLALGAGAAISFTATSTILFYSELGWMASMWTAMTERQSSIYFGELLRQVLASAPFLSEIGSEALP